MQIKLYIYIYIYIYIYSLNNALISLDVFWIDNKVNGVILAVYWFNWSCFKRLHIDVGKILNSAKLSEKRHLVQDKKFSI